jgi:hypothetical protein
MSKRTKESIDPKADPIREQVIAAMDRLKLTSYAICQMVREIGGDITIPTIVRYRQRKSSLSTGKLWPILQILGLELVETGKKSEK